MVIKNLQKPALMKPESSKQCSVSAVSIVEDLRKWLNRVAQKISKILKKCNLV